MKTLSYGILFLLLVSYLLSASDKNDQNLPAKGQLISVPNYKSIAKINSLQMDTTEVYIEDFESGGSSWSVSGSWQIGNPTSGPASGYNSTNCAGTNLNGAYSNSADDWLISPEISLPTLNGAKENLQLLFYEWYAIESGYDYGRVKISTDSGVTWNEIENRSGSSDWRKTSIDISSYSGQTIKIAFHLTSDGSVTYDGWFVDNIKIAKITEAPLSVKINSLNPSNFPFIYLNVAVDTFGTGISTLSTEHFEVYENNLKQTDYFEVTPPEESGGSRLSDIVFVLDVTGSMSEEIDQVKANMEEFVDSLAASDIDYGVGFVVFGDVTYTYNDGNFYYDKETILSIIDNIQLGEHGIGTGDDTPENQLQAMADGALFNYRPGAQKVEIMITDAYAHENDDVTSWTVPNLIDLLTSNKISVYPVFDTNNSYQNNQYIPIAEATNTDGDYYYIYDNFNGIINDISQTIGNTYVIRYKSSEPVFDGVERHVEVKVTYDGNIDSDTASYIPGSSPDIQRTAETIELHNQAWAEGTEFDIKAEITDAVEPFVQSATLFYRTSGESNYKSLTMTVLSGNIYHAIIPGSDVVTPGLEYYITATDGQSTSSDPSVDPTSNPYVLGILPNQAPVIVHAPVEYGIIDESVIIDAQITDETNMLTNTILFYRKTGQLIYNQLEMTDMGSNNFQATIPPEYMTEDGVDYYIKAYDDFNVSATHGTFDHPHQILARQTSIPLIIVPGIMSSPLFNDSNDDNSLYYSSFHFNKDEFIWADSKQLVESPTDKFLDVLQLAEDGISPLSAEYKIKVAPIVNDNALTIRHLLGLKPLSYYQGLISELESTKNNYKLDDFDYNHDEYENLYIFTYDWRKSNTLSADNLSAFIENVRVWNSTDKVNILVHSMGGLVTKKYLEKYGPSKIKKLIFIGTPHLGAPKDLYAIATGKLTGKLGLVTNDEEMKKISRNMPSVYELMPSELYTNTSYYNGSTTSGLDIYEYCFSVSGSRTTYDEMIDFYKNFVSNDGFTFNKTLIDNSVDFKSLVENITFGDIEVFNIVGFNQTTIGRVAEWELFGKYHFSPVWNASGDGTVPLRSAEIINHSKVKADYYIEDVEHSDLPSAEPVVEIVTGLLKKSSQTSGFIDEDHKIYYDPPADYATSYTLAWVGCPVELHAYDAYGNHTGPTSDSTWDANIPNSKYIPSDLKDPHSKKMIVLPSGEHITLKIISQDTTASFDFLIEEVPDGNTIKRTYFDSVAITSTSIGTCVIDSTTEIFQLNMDYDGNGAVDSTIHPVFVTGLDKTINQNIPHSHLLFQNYPNPFNNITKIKYGLPKAEKVRIILFNIKGQKVATLTNQYMQAGIHEMKFDASNLASGVYIYMIKAGNFVSTRKMILLK